MKYKEGKILTTKTSGRIIIEKFVSKDEIHIKFLDTNTKRIVATCQLTSLNIKDPYKPRHYGVGFFGSGIYSHKDNKDVYNCWSDMLRRCYCPKRQEVRPTYKGCTVCEEWHNFQNFAEWYYQNLPDKENKYQIDKDIKFSGNKLYSPDTCLLVTGVQNNVKAHEKSYTLEHKEDGLVEVTNLKNFCKTKGLSESVMYMLVNKRWGSHRGYKLYENKNIKSK